MGAMQSLDDQFDSAGQQSVVSSLSKCELRLAGAAYQQLHSGYPGEDTTISPSTLALGLPLPISIATALVNLLNDTQTSTIHIRDCFNVLTFFACGSVDDRTRLFYAIHGWSLEEAEQQQVDRETLEESLLRLLHAVHRIYQADPWIQISGSSDGLCNLLDIAGELVDEIQQVSGLPTFTFSDIQKWLLGSLSTCFTTEAMYPAHHQDKDKCASIDNVSNNSSLGGDSYTWVRVACDEGRHVPSCRSKHAVAVHGGYVYLYGGRDGNIGHKDLWRFEIASNAWERMTCGGDRPFLLQDHTMIAYNGKLYVFGGEFSSWSHEAPLWTLDLVRKTWTRPHVVSEVAVPCGRRSHTAVITNHQMHIYGGFLDLKGSSSDLWTYDLDHEMWHLSYRADGSEDGPGSRHAHSAVIHDNAMWVYGGMSDLAPRSDLWCWHFKSRNWTKFKNKNGPPPLAGHSSCRVSTGMILYGGECGGVIQADLWKFTFSSQTWQRLLCDGLTPSPRSQHCVIVLPSFLLQQAWLAAGNDCSLSVPLLKQLTVPESDPRPKSSPAFCNTVSPACPHVELIKGKSGQMKYDTPTIKSTTHLENTISLMKQVTDKLGRLSKSSDTVELIAAQEQSMHMVVDPLESRTSNNIKNVTVEGRAEEIRKHLRQMRKTKTIDSVSLCRLLSSTSDSSEEWLSYDNCVSLENSGHLNLVGEEGSPVKRPKSHSVNEQCYAPNDTYNIHLKSASVESILSMSHNSKLPPPHWLSYRARSKKDITRNAMAGMLRSQSWDSLLRSFGGVGLSCTKIDLDTDPTAIKMTSIINSADCLIIEDLEDCTVDLTFSGSFDSARKLETWLSATPQSQHISIPPLYNDVDGSIISNEWGAMTPKQKDKASLPDILVDVSDPTVVEDSILAYRTRAAQRDKEQGFLSDCSTTPTNSPSNTINITRRCRKGAMHEDIELTDFSYRENGSRQSCETVPPGGGLKRYLSHMCEMRCNGLMKLCHIKSRLATNWKPFKAQRDPTLVVLYAFSPLFMGVRTCDTVHVYVFGGKESESCNIGIKPLPVWRLDVHELSTRKQHAEAKRK